MIPVLFVLRVLEEIEQIERDMRGTSPLNAVGAIDLIRRRLSESSVPKNPTINFDELGLAGYGDEGPDADFDSFDSDMVRPEGQEGLFGGFLRRAVEEDGPAKIV